MFSFRARRDDLTDLPRIETARLSIRALRTADAAAVARLTDDPAITRAVDFLPSPFTVADAQDLIRGGARGRDRFLGAFARVDEPGGALPAALVGIVGAHLRGPGTVEIGTWIGGAARGRGFAFEAVTGILGLLRGRFPGRVIVAECRPGNVAAWGLLLKLGFRETGDEGHRPGRRVLRHAQA